VDDCPEFQTVLESGRGQNLTNQLWSEFVFGTTPEGGEAKLSVGIKKGLFEETLLWMEEVANKRIVEARLPFLNECHFKTAVVGSVCVDWNRRPNI